MMGDRDRATTGIAIGGRVTPGGLRFTGHYLYQLAEHDWFDGTAAFTFGGGSAACFRDRSDTFICDHGLADGGAIEIAAGVRRMFASQGAFRPFARVAVGVSYVRFGDDDVTGFVIPVHAGAGVRARVSADVAVVALGELAIGFGRFGSGLEPSAARARGHAGAEFRLQADRRRERVRPSEREIRQAEKIRLAIAGLSRRSIMFVWWWRAGQRAGRLDDARAARDRIAASPSGARPAVRSWCRAPHRQARSYDRASRRRCPIAPVRRFVGWLILATAPARSRSASTRAAVARDPTGVGCGHGADRVRGCGRRGRSAQARPRRLVIRSSARGLRTARCRGSARPCTRVG
jgi:hypothetical protein